ncbi:SAVED domain-containing protein [Streptomyces erythrochromogenes]|uniref:SAVED domain-containing protein n=1 Tax=Streptomyces erythrochromogenes TaxID=285574 RepID=UPI00382B5ACA
MPPADEAVLVLNISGTIQPGELPPQLAGLRRYRISPADAAAAPDIMRHHDSLARFQENLRALFADIEANAKAIRRLHILPAVPLSAAVSLGRVHDRQVRTRTRASSSGSNSSVTGSGHPPRRQRPPSPRPGSRPRRKGSPGRRRRGSSRRWVRSGRVDAGPGSKPVSRTPSAPGPRTCAVPASPPSAGLGADAQRSPVADMSQPAGRRRRRGRGRFLVAHRAPRSTVTGNGAVAFTVPVNTSPSR